MFPLTSDTAAITHFLGVHTELPLTPTERGALLAHCQGAAFAYASSSNARLMPDAQQSQHGMPSMDHQQASSYMHPVMNHQMTHMGQIPMSGSGMSGPSTISPRGQGSGRGGMAMAVPPGHESSHPQPQGGYVYRMPMQMAAPSHTLQHAQPGGGSGMVDPRTIGGAIMGPAVSGGVSGSKVGGVHVSGKGGGSSGSSASAIIASSTMSSAAVRAISDDYLKGLSSSMVMVDQVAGAAASDEHLGQPLGPDSLCEPSMPVCSQEPF